MIDRAILDIVQTVKAASEIIMCKYFSEMKAPMAMLKRPQLNEINNTKNEVHRCPKKLWPRFSN